MRVERAEKVSEEDFRVQTVHRAAQKRVASCYVKQFLMRRKYCGFGSDGVVAYKAGTDIYLQK